MTRRRYPEPRWQTPLPPTVAGSWGPAVAAWAELELGIVLDRWQRRALNRALAVDAQGRLVHRHYLISTARQNGKTALVRALIGWALTALGTPPWGFILGLAHDRTQARIPYQAVLADLEPIARRAGPLGRRGLALTRFLGIRSAMGGRIREYHVASREAAAAIRGYSVDLGVFDEVRTQRDHATWAALEPTTTARDQPLILAISTAGDDRSVVLRDWWERGLRIIAGDEPWSGYGMTWYAAGDQADPEDPRAWWAASPAIADGRIRPEVIAESMRSMPPAVFRQERLNLWTEGTDEWLPSGTWTAGDVAGAPALEGATVALGVEVTPSWSRASIVAVLELDGRTWAGMAGELVAGRDSAGAALDPAAVLAALGKLLPVWRPSVVAYSALAAMAPHLEAWARPSSLAALPLTPRQLRAASELFRAELVGRRLTHPPDPVLATQVRTSRPSGAIEAGGWYLSIRESVGDVDAVRAMAWGLYAVLRPDELEVAPQLFL